MADYKITALYSVPALFLSRTKDASLIVEKMCNTTLTELVELTVYSLQYSYQRLAKAFVSLLVSPSNNLITRNYALKLILIFICAFHLLWLTPIVFGILVIRLFLTKCKYNIF